MYEQRRGSNSLSTVRRRLSGWHGSHLALVLPSKWQMCAGAWLGKAGQVTG